MGDDVLESYRQRGYTGPFTLFEPGLAQQLFRRIDTEVFPALSDTYGHTQADAVAASYRKSFDLSRARDRHLDSPLLHRIASSREIVSLLSPILGPDILLWRSDSFDQSAGDTPTPPHQDRTYEGSRATDPMIEPGEEDMPLAHQEQPFECDIPLSMNIWIAFTPIRKETGALWFAPGSHTSLAPTKIGAGFAGIPFVLSRDYADDRQVVEVDAGQCFLFDNLVVHGTLPSELGRRFAWTCRYVSTKTHIHRRAKIGPQGQDLSRWGAVLVSGQDRFQRNVLRAPPPTSDAAILQERALASSP